MCGELVGDMMARPIRDHANVLLTADPTVLQQPADRGARRRREGRKEKVVFSRVGCFDAKVRNKRRSLWLV